METRIDPEPLSAMRGASYSDTIKSALAEERATKTSIEQRGVGIVTTSGVLATLLFGFGAFVYGSKSPNISSEGTGFLITSVVLFVVAATFGLLANRPAKYREADIPSLRERTEKEEWHKPSPAEAARRDSILNVNIIEVYRQTNATKSMFVYIGIGVEILAVSCVASVLIVILGGVNDQGTEYGAIGLSVLALLGLAVLWELLWRTLRPTTPGKGEGSPPVLKDV